MKTKSKFQIAARALLCALTTIIGLTAALKVQAASQTWTNAPVDNSWTNILNWNSGAVPGALNSSATADVATFTNALPISGIGGAGNPITNDLTRGVRGMIFDGPDCGAYVFGHDLSDNWLEIMHTGNITMNAAVTNPITFNTGFRTKLPSSTNGRYDFTNNATSQNAVFFIAGYTNSSANTRPMETHLAGSNTGTNTIARIDDQAAGAGAILIIKEGTGKWIFTGPNDLPQKTSAGVVATVQVNNGTLVVQDPGSLGAITAANLVVQTAGTLQIDGVTLNNAGITLRSGGTIRMNGSATVNSVIVGNAVATSATLATTSAGDVMTISAGAVTPSGGAADTVLHVAGPGTVLLSQSATYIGKWSVDAGTNQLGVAGALGAGANLNINAGAVFDVTPLGATTYTLDTKALSANGTGTTVGSTAATIMADPAATVDFVSKPITLTFTPIASAGDSGHPALYCSQGTLSFHGNSITVSNASVTPLGAGTYQLVHQASGSIVSSGGFVALVTGSGLGTGLIPEIVATGGDLNLVISAYTPKNLVWNGGDITLPDTWDRLTSINWLAGATPSTFNIYDSVIFNATGSAHPNVNLAATMAPGSVTVDTSANNYTFSGVGQIAGGTSLVKINTGGTLTLQTANTYSGGTIISNGVVKLGVDEGVSSTGAGDLALYSPAVFDLNNFSNTVNGLNGSGTVDITGGGTSTLNIGENGNSGTFSGVIQNSSGTLGIFKSGNGTETLTASNSYVGPTIIDIGTLRVTNLYALGAGVSAVTINNGALDVATNLLVASLGGTGGTIVNNSTAATVTNTLIIQGASTVNSLISGRLALLINGGTVRLNAANTYSGGTIVASGAGLAYGGGAASAGSAGVIASNNVTISMPNTGSGSSGPGNAITTADGATVTFTSGTTANSWNGQFIGSVLATNIIANGNMSIGGAYSFSNFLGTVIISNGAARMFNAVGGGDNTTFIFTNGGGMFTRDANVVRLGALFGNGAITGPSVNFPGTYWIGAKGVDSEYSGGISGSNNIVKTGAGRLTLDGVTASGTPYSNNNQTYTTNIVDNGDGTYTTNIVDNGDQTYYTNITYTAVISYINNTTVSNGVLALSVPNVLDNSPTITLGGTNAVLDASNMGYVTNFTDIHSNPDSALVTNGVLTLLATTPNGTPQSLNGFGTVKGNGVISSGAINPGSAGGGGTLSISNGLTINAGASNYFDLSDDLTGLVKPSDMILVQGNVTLSGSSIIGIGALNGNIKVGKYTLIKYSGNLINESGIVPSGAIPNFTLGGVIPASARATLVISNAPGEVDLIVVSLNNLDLTWTGDGLSNRWDVVDSYTFTNFINPMQFYQMDNVTFDGTANPTNNSVFLSGTMAPGTLTVNSITNIIFGGNGNIQGSVTLMKKGSGTLILTNGANSYSGGTILSNGLVNVGSDSGGNQNDLALGTGPVIVNATAELRFGGNSGGVVRHFITNAITINGGTVKAQDGEQHLTNSIVTITASGATLQTVFATKNLVFDSPVVGTGPLTISVPAGFVGGSVVFNNPNNTLSGAVVIATTNGVLALVGSAGLSNSPSIDVQLGGILDVSARTNAAWQVLSGQTLKGNGTIRGRFVTTAAGSTLAPGVASSIGTLTVTNFGNTTNFATVTLGGTTTMDINRASAPNSDRLVTGTNVFGGTLTVNNLGVVPVAGDVFQLFTSITNKGTFAILNLPSLPTGFAWSNSLAANGRLTVVTTVLIPTNSAGITSFILQGNNVVITGTNGNAGATYYLLVSTNVAKPFPQWKTVWTNIMGTTGTTNGFTFTGSNAVTPNALQQFYILSSTNYNP